MNTQKIFALLWDTFLARVREESEKTSQSDVAKRLGVARGNITKWMNGTIRSTDIHDFSRYLDIMGVNIFEVIRLELSPEQNNLLAENENLSKEIEILKKELQESKNQNFILLGKIEVYREITNNNSNISPSYNKKGA